MNAAALPSTHPRWTSAAAGLLAGAALLALVGAAAHWAMRRPVWDFSRVQIAGDVQHNSEATLRANVLPRLSGNFFSLDLQAAKTAFEQAPWVRRAVVRRTFPNRLLVHLSEHVPVAIIGAEGDSRLVNSFGEVFVANAAEITADLPRFVGDESQSARMLKLYQTASEPLKLLELAIDELQLRSNGSWVAELDSGATLELGRGEPQEIAQRVAQFTSSLSTAAAQVGRKASDLEAADLRYPQGYALQLRGIKTQSSPVNATPPARQ
jgi:cell division protein FtsQ